MWKARELSGLQQETSSYVLYCQAQHQLQLKLGWDGYIPNYPSHPATHPAKYHNTSKQVVGKQKQVSRQFGRSAGKQVGR